jgi:guanylate kinase
MQDKQPGRLVILSGPSGTGKSTVVQHLQKECSMPLVLSVSATTRPPRKNEQPGVDYHYLSDEDFARRRNENEFLECFEVFGRGYWYGTLRSEVESRLAEGNWVLLEIDVHGAAQILQQFSEVVTIFLSPGSMEVLEQRLRDRGTESEEAIQKRLATAAVEFAAVERYQHVVVNNDVSQAVQKICDILTKSGE